MVDLIGNCATMPLYQIQGVSAKSNICLGGLGIEYLGW